MISFGIFDVLITKRTLYPTGIFLLIQDRINRHQSRQTISEYIMNHFAVIRENAEGYARMIKKREINLSDIYDVFMKMSCAGVEQARYLMDLELQIELENVIGIDSNIAFLKKKILNNEKVVLISDTYFSAEQIRAMLQKVDKEIANLPIYASNEYNQTKRSGGLYLTLQHDIKVSFSEWEHYGSDSVSDKLMPETIGIQAVCLKESEPMLWEKKMAEDGEVECNLVYQIYLGVLKTIRTRYTLDRAKRIGAAFGGCLLYPYVWWIIQISIKKDYRRLYFIARDGYILKKIADIIIGVYGYQIMTKYIYGSRKAWRENSDNEAKHRMFYYLTQEVDFTDEKFAFVDLQGTGFSMECVQKTLQPIYDRPLNIFYYYYFPKKENTQCNVIPFLFLDHGNLLEPFARAPHGATLGYEYDGVKAKPIVAETNRRMWIKSGLDEYNQGVELFAESLTKTLKDLQLSGDYPSMAIWLVNYLKYGADSELSEYVGEIPHNNSTRDTKSVFAPRLNVKDIFLINMWRTTEDISVYYKGINYQITMSRLSSKEKKLVYFLEKRYFSLTGRLLHKIKHVVTKKIDLPSYKRIVIYAAGQAGRMLYNYINYKTTSKVVGWTDLQYQNYQNQGYPVISLRDALKRDYDVIVIAIENSTISWNAKKIILAMGVKVERVKTLEEFRHVFSPKNRGEE